MAEEIGAWRECPTEIDRPIRIAGLVRPYQLIVAFLIWVIYAPSHIHPATGLVAIFWAGLYLGVAVYFSQQIAPRFILHAIHYWEFLPFANLLFPGLMTPKRVVYQPW